ncbi:uncharacterized protein VTP21DRAFT_8702 [Calcarisporiella thermophila]|uniref:uncharacterized protein n=1 Tax=Calcarisporiella thermophila TaxID=911321 RepID=UPI003743E477
MDDQEIDNFIPAIREAIRLNSDPTLIELIPVAFDASFIWYINANVIHPLRAHVGRFRSFILITKGPSSPIPLQAWKRVIVGPPPTERKSFLGCVEDLSQIITEEKHITNHLWEPLSSDDARFYLSLYSVAHSSGQTDQLPPILAYCQDDSKSFLGVQTDNLKFTMLDIRDCGFVSEKEHTEYGPIPTLDELLDEYADLTGEQNENCVGQVFARYDILSGTMPNSENNQDATSSSIQLEVTWQGMPKPLATPPSSSDSALHIRCVHGDPENIASLPWLEELIRLNEWQELTMAGKRWERADNDVVQMRPVDERIDTFLNDIKDLGGAVEEDEPMMPARVDTFTTLPARKGLDFTEKLWKLCLDAVDQDDLVETLTAVVEEVESGNLQPLIHKDNRSNFANLIRSTLRLSRLQTSADYNEQKESISRTFDYWLENPLECLVEVGISKLRRDYCHYLIGNDLLSWSELEPFLDETSPLPDQIHSLGRLHRLFELWCLVRTNLLVIPHESMRSLMRAAAAHYRPEMKCNDKALLCTLRCPRFSATTDKMLNSIVRSFEPSFWELSISEEAEGPILLMQMDRADTLFRADLETTNNEMQNPEVFPMRYGHLGQYRLIFASAR